MTMTKQAYLRDENLLTLLSLHDFIIPEIQREYVWGSSDNCNKILKPFLVSIKNNAEIDEHCHHAHSRENQHIGFLYSYKPQYIRDLSNRITDEYLIDGQQRFTSLFLLLLIRAVRENRMVDFCNLIRWGDNVLAFDYKVRQLTHRFIFDLIAHLVKDGADTIQCIKSREYPSWLLKDYQEDITIGNILNAIRCIEDVFPNNEDCYYDYLLTKIHFWHFKTDVTSQGEELYITMNSRGEELSVHEFEKSRKLKGTDQLKWGEKWEEWQTYFWRNRANACEGKPNFDADKGFNNLLSCLDAMGKAFSTGFDSIEDIEIAIDALQFIVDTDWEVVLHQFDAEFYTEWVGKLKRDIWGRINTTTAKWTIEHKSDTTQKENAVLLWPLFYYYYLAKGNNSEPDKLTFVRLMHLCYLNYHSKKTNHEHIRSFVEALFSSHSDMTNLGSLYLNFEEKYISEEHIYISNLIHGDSDYKLESMIWQLQDKEYFLDGENVGGDTIFRFLKDILGQGIDVKNGIKNMLEGYDTLFPANDRHRNEILVKRILLHYKDENGQTFWKQTSPYYNRNYETSSWKRIIRCNAFMIFYNEISRKYTYSFSEQDLVSFVEKKQNEFYSDDSNRVFNSKKWSDRRLAIFFDTITEGRLWSQNNYPDLGFYESTNLEAKAFIDKTRIGNRICGRKNQWQMKELPANWEWHLQNMYRYYDFHFD